MVATYRDDKSVSRRNGRILAVQALYAWDVGSSPLEDLLSFEWTKRMAHSDELIPKPNAPKDKSAQAKTAAVQDETQAEQEHEELSPSRKLEMDFARLLVTGTVSRIAEIDKRIKSHLAEGWEFDRLDRVTLAILRTSVFALLWQRDVSSTIVIDEAIAISKAFALDDSFKFINAILDTIAKEETT